LRYTPEAGRIELELRDEGHGVEIRIGNTGERIAPEERTAIFDKHQRGNGLPSQTNLGLGLYFCRLATEAQGGTIGVEETDALPTVFAIRLPRVHPNRATA
jgi:signal transduction histidine kinase